MTLKIFLPLLFLAVLPVLAPRAPASDQTHPGRAATVKEKLSPQAPPLTRDELNIKRQTVRLAFDTLLYKRNELNGQYKSRQISEAQFNVEDLKLKVEDKKLRLRESELCVDDAMLRVKETQEYVIKCLDGVREARTALADAQKDLQEAQATSR